MSSHEPAQSSGSRELSQLTCELSSIPFHYFCTNKGMTAEQNACIVTEERTEAPLDIHATETPTLPFSVACLPSDYITSVLEKIPFAEDSDIIEAYLGYGPHNVPCYKQWSRVMEECS